MLSSLTGSHQKAVQPPYTVYDIVKQPGRYVLLPVGLAPPGLLCDPTQDVSNYNVVPTDSVAWFGSVRPPVVVALCA